ncbi:uncharacterized protein LOC124431171 [Vespa crabro]|uniref:uncharacterized protein LOC124431171 n=1 Tax=Vespa crabro TaxID=7445 RepID=UPI001F020F3E|nr:uncharacterized protein LOC124431171 [Vespa crabro]
MENNKQISESNLYEPMINNGKYSYEDEFNGSSKKPWNYTYSKIQKIASIWSPISSSSSESNWPTEMNKKFSFEMEDFNSTDNTTTYSESITNDDKSILSDEVFMKKMIELIILMEEPDTKLNNTFEESIKNELIVPLLFADKNEFLSLLPSFPNENQSIQNDSEIDWNMFNDETQDIPDQFHWSPNESMTKMMILLKMQT